MRTYVVSKKPIVSTYFKASGTKILRDDRAGLEPSIQTQYIELVMGMLLKTLIKAYGPTNFSESDIAKLKRYLDKLIEAKAAEAGELPKGGIYKRQA